jgi:putative CocE/NonD family hydrolase
MLRGDARKLGLASASRRLEDAATRLPALLAAAPYSRLACLTARGLPTYHRDWTTRREAGAWWSRHDVSTRMDRIRVPALHLWGWFDTYLDGSERLYQRLRRDSTAPQYLVAGPWTHIPWGRRSGDVDHGPDAVLDTDRLLLRWFNHWLKDSGEFDDEPPVRSFALGENRWLRLDAWQGGAGATAAGQRWFLDSDGRANANAGDGRLETHPPKGDRPRDGFVHEPEVPVAAPGPGAAPGPHLQDRQDSMNNVLAYTSAPLTASLRIAGRPRVRLNATSRTASADLVAKLVRVLADGRSLFVCIGIARSSWLFGRGGLVPDRVQCWEFDLEPTHCVFAPGERIRLVVSGSAFPLYDRNPGSEVSPERAETGDWIQNQQQILHDETHPSWLELPLEPAAEAMTEDPRP